MIEQDCRAATPGVRAITPLSSPHCAALGIAESSLFIEPTPVSGSDIESVPP